MGMEEWLEKYPPVKIDKSAGEERKKPNISKKKLSKFPVQRTLDLHGFTAEQARAEVEFFLKESRRLGLRKVLIIHGKGYHSEGQPVLKKEVFRLLEKNPLTGSFGPADRKEGGSGAVWVLLK